MEAKRSLLSAITELGFQCKSDTELIRLADELLALCATHDLHLAPGEYTKVLYYRERAYLNTMRYTEALNDIVEWLNMRDKWKARLLTARDIFGATWIVLMDAGKAYAGLGDTHMMMEMFSQAFDLVADQSGPSGRLARELGLILRRTGNPTASLELVPNPGLRQRIIKEMRW
jgi:hypothetical protein